MAAIMTVHMNMRDDGWVAEYFEKVPALLAEYGAVTIAAARRGIRQIEGSSGEPHRIAILAFPSLDAIERFMADERYQPFRRAREAGAASEIFAFENAVKHGELV